jgi:hypothetical protein
MKNLDITKEPVDSCVIVRSEKVDGVKLLYRGYAYKRNRVDSPKYWICCKEKCKDRLIVDGFDAKSLLDTNKGKPVTLLVENTIKLTEKFESKHLNHFPDTDLMLCEKVKSLIYEEAMETTEDPREIVKKVYGALAENETSQALMSKSETITKQINQLRARKLDRKADPITLKTLVLSDKDKLDGRQKNFLIYDQFQPKVSTSNASESDDDEECDEDDDDDEEYEDDQLDYKNRIIIFATDLALQYLSTCLIWSVDGTFDSAPTHFKQVFTVNGVKGGKCVPCVFALLCNKRQHSYSVVFEAIRKHVLNQPKAINTDFEKAILNAIQSNFPSTKIYGCYFHLASNLWKNVQKKGLCSQFIRNSKFQIAFNRLKCLPFVHLRHIFLVFELLRKESGEEFQPILDYFEKYYLGLKKDPNSKLRIKPTYPPLFWNVYDRVECKAARSNNQIEAWHKHFNGSINSYPTISKFIANLKEEMLTYEGTLSQVGMGELAVPPAAERRKAMRIEHVHSEYHLYENDLLKYLTNMLRAINNEELEKETIVLSNYKEVDIEKVEIF